jgi:hypothetical protein
MKARRLCDWLIYASWPARSPDRTRVGRAAETGENSCSPRT